MGVYTLKKIQAGKQLRSVGSQNVEKPNNKADARDNVMAQIRQWAQLKHVNTTAEQEKRRSESLPEIGGLAGALARALEERRMNMGLDDSSEEEESDEVRQWAQLKHVNTTAEQEKRRSESLPEIGGLAGALTRAFEERRMNMALDDSSEEEESDEKNDDWGLTIAKYTKRQNL